MYHVIIATCLSYLLGSLPTSYLLGKLLKGIDLREHGSGNLGTTNAFRVLGIPAGLIVLLIDSLKGFVPAFFFARFIENKVHTISLTVEQIGVLLGVVAILGHMYTVFVGFKGGKGVATSMGLFLALAPVPLLITVPVCLVVMAVSRYVSLGSMVGAVLLPVFILLLKPESGLLLVVTVSIGIIVIIKHRANISRILNRTENKIWQ